MAEQSEAGRGAVRQANPAPQAPSPQPSPRKRREGEEIALTQAALASSYRDDAWRHNEPPPIPSMTADEAMMLLRLHHQSVRLQEEPPHLKRRRGESREAHSYRLSAMY